MRDLMRYFYDKSTGSYNKIKLASQRWRVLRDIAKISMPRALFFMSVYIFKSLLKYRNL